jgi:general L-amino acid transport system permease protein
MTAQTIPEKTAVERPPAATVGPIAWIRGNLFNTWYNALITVAIAWALISWLPGLINWAFIDAVWGRAAPEACKAAEGACWAFIREKHRLILFGTYPYEEQWRPLASILIFVTLVAASGYRKFWSRKLVYVWIAALLLICLLMWGGVFGLPLVETRLWGGLMITLVLSVFGCGIAFPIAVLLALGRRSNLPIIKALSVTYIELIRGVPLVTLLFMASVMIPLFLPEGLNINKLLRAQIAIIMFAAAYLAEVVRGGLQAIPKGQYEAADALGLGYWQKMRLIILPQALKISIPSTVNSFLSTLKDTSLVVIIGIFDLMLATRAALNDAPWRTYFAEAYVFAALVYFVFCFAISRYSQWLERYLGRGAHR